MPPSFRATREISLALSRNNFMSTTNPALATFSRCLLALATIALAALSAPAQVPTGTPPFGSFGGGPDVINLANLNSHIAIPVLHKPGRGTDFTYDLSYDTSVWYPVTSGGTTAWQSVPNWGWRGQTEVATGYVSLTETISHLSPHCTDYIWSNFVYHDPFGIPHPFYGSVDYQAGPPYYCDHSGGSINPTSPDGSGYVLFAIANSGSGVTLTVTSSSGEITRPPSSAGNAAANSTDRNGNLISTDGNGNFYDTLSSTTPVLTVSGSGTPLSPVTFSYTAPSGTSASYIAKYAAFTVQTIFGCSGVSEYGPTSNNLVTEIDLPDYNQTTNPNERYTFTYETTPGDVHSPHYVTGRLASVTLPTGGTISYSYSGGNNGINCSDGSAATLTRTTPDGTWTYAHVKGTGAASTTTVTAPQLSYDPTPNQTVIQFQGIYETQRKVYQGLSGSGTLLQTVDTCYNGSASPCTATAITLPIAQIAETVQLDSSGWICKHVASYNSFGLPTEMDDYDYGSGAPPATPFKKTLISYAALGNNINASQQTVTVQDATGATAAQTQYNYDETSVTATTGTPQHTTVSGSRGNLTSVKYLVQGSTYLSKIYSYYDTGNVRVGTDFGGAQTTYTYGACGNSFPTQQTTSSGSLLLSNSMSWDCNGGVLTSTSDTNGQSTGSAYDTFWRVTALTRPDNVQLTYQYPTASNLTYVVTTPVQGANSSVSTTTLDSLGRPIKITSSDASQTVYSISDTQYDSLGRSYKFSNPYISSAQYWTTTEFDALGRPTVQILQDGAQATYSYSGRTTTATDPTGKQAKYDYDSSGRIVSVYEPDVSNNNSLTVQTNYTYTPLGQISTVNQGVQSRTYNYDQMGRLTSETTPEAGQVNFQYNSAGLLAQRTDARNVQTNYIYDGLSRLIGQNYNIPQGTAVAPMPNVCDPWGNPTPSQNVCYYYDQGGAPAFASGRLTKVVDTSGSEMYTFDQLGRTIQVSKTIGTTTYNTQYQYNLANEITAATYPSGRVVQGSYDAIGRTCAIGNSGSTCSSGTTFASGFSYSASGQLMGVTYGNGVIGTFSYSADRLQLSSIGYVKGAQTLFGANYMYKTDSNNCLTGAAGNNGQVQCIIDTVDSGRTIAYSYDALYRMTSAVTNGSANYPKWGLSWAYDRYGNRLNQTATAGNPPTNSLSFANPGGAQTNRPDNMCFDASGNLTAESGTCPPAVPTYVYDAENRLVSYGGTAGAYTYDAHGLRVSKSSAITTTVYIFSGSKVIAEYDNGAVPTSPSREYIYAGSGLLAKIEGGVTSYFHNDHLSARVLTDSSGNILGQLGHYPFGDTWYETGITTKWKFTSYERDSESGNDYALTRSFVSRYGRFSSPDPLSGGLDDPQSLNRYAYAHNDPCNQIDPLGLASTCVLNVRLKNGKGVALSDADIKAITDRVNSLLGSTQTPDGVGVQIQTSYSGSTDYTLTFSNRGDTEILLEHDIYGSIIMGDGEIGGPNGNVYPDAISFSSYLAFGTMSEQMLQGGIAAHELVHMSGNFRDEKYSILNVNTMMMDSAGEVNKSAANAMFSDPNSGLWKLTPVQVQAMYKDCIKKHPPHPPAQKAGGHSGRGGGGGGSSSVGPDCHFDTGPGGIPIYICSNGYGCGVNGCGCVGDDSFDVGSPPCPGWGGGEGPTVPPFVKLWQFRPPRESVDMKSDSYHPSLRPTLSLGKIAQMLL
jgi:RHS repeat-associated protein